MSCMNRRALEDLDRAPIASNHQEDDHDSDSSTETLTQERFDLSHGSKKATSDESAMEIAIRWSPLSTPTEARFLIADVVGRTFKHCCVKSYAKPFLQWEELSRVTKVPAFRAFDWSPSNNVIAVGQWSGETTVINLDTGTHVKSYSIKSQRQCNAVAFNTGSLLAAGLERVRNDFCLNVYDINQQISGNGPFSPTSSTRPSVDPVRKLATSEGITSIKFFSHQPKTLVAGVKGTCVRIYDLREDTTNPSLQYQTACVHNLAIDPTDENYFASAAPPKDTTVLIWDRRSTNRPISTRSNATSTQDGPILELKRSVEGREPSGSTSIWRLQFSSTERSCLGVLASNGHFRVHQLRKDYIENHASHAAKDTRKEQDVYARPLSVSHVHTVEHPPHSRRSGSKDRDQEELGHIVSFDFTNIFAPQQRPCAITLRGNQEIGMYELPGRPPALAVSTRNSLVVSHARRAATSSQIEAHCFLGLTLKQADQSGTISDTLIRVNDHERVCIQFNDALTTNDVARRRCLEGYLFDAEKNMHIVKEDPHLQEMWKWIKTVHKRAVAGDMVTENIDFSYLGVYSLWKQDLGQLDSRIQSREPIGVSIADSVASLVQSLGLQDTGLPEANATGIRLLCLHNLGFSANPSHLYSTVRHLAENGENTQGCLLALIFDNLELALKALQPGLRNTDDFHKGLAMALTAFSLIEDGGSGGDRRKQALERIEVSMPTVDEPYAEAIARYVTTGEWMEVLQLDPLSLRFKIGIALMSLNDKDLAAYLAEETARVIVEGNVEGVVLTGLSSSTVDLFESYIEKTSDLQTAVLAMSFVSPRYVRDARIDLWRKVYRSQLNTWSLHMERTWFDTESTKLSVTWDGTKTLKASPPQVTLRCNKCGEALNRESAQDSRSASTMSATGGRSQGGIFGDARSETVCPKCNAHLPRCTICDLWLGVPDPRSRGAATDGRDPFSWQLEICLSCRHMYHRGHADEWFARHEKCPVPDCDCHCNELDEAET